MKIILRAFAVEDVLIRVLQPVFQTEMCVFFELIIYKTKIIEP